MDSSPRLWNVEDADRNAGIGRVDHKVEFGEKVRETATREFLEETGLQAEVTDLLTVSEVILPERPYHSITVAFSGRITGGTLKPEAGHPYGRKVPRWLSVAELQQVSYHPGETVRLALAMKGG